MPQLPTGVINEFAHPPWGVLQRELIGTFTSSGNPHILTRVRGPINVDAFGIAWDLFTVPAGAGYTLGVVKTYQDRFLQIGVRYTDLSGHDFYGEVLPIVLDGLYFMWDQPIPTSIDAWVFPNYAINLYWLVAL